MTKIWRYCISLSIKFYLIKDMKIFRLCTSTIFGIGDVMYVVIIVTLLLAISKERERE